MNDPLLQIAAARYVLGVLPSWELVRVADAALDHGLYSPSLGELVTAGEPVMAVAGPLFEQALRELGVPLPAPEAAAWGVLRHRIGRLAAGVVSPRQGIYDLAEEVDHISDMLPRSRSTFRHAHGIEPLYDCFWGYYELAGQPEAAFNGLSREDLDREAVRLAREWVAQYDMPEAAWRACADPAAMLKTLAGRASDRKLRLVADAGAAEGPARAALLRELFGPLPFRAVALAPAVLAWNDGRVVKIAQTIHDERRFADLPILADALEDAGCDDADVLEHCRGTAEHVRGCWVLDLVLGQE